MPNDPDVQFDFGLFLSQHGNPGEAMNYFSAALKRHPDFPAALNQLAWILSTSPNFKLRDGKKAVELAERASELTQNKRPDVLTTLAAAYAEIGQFEKAIIVAQQARSFALTEGQKEIAAKDDLLLKNFQASQPFHDSM
jgi:tetratricopeptide (TPR) repeat protein